MRLSLSLFFFDEWNKRAMPVKVDLPILMKMIAGMRSVGTSWEKEKKLWVQFVNKLAGTRQPTNTDNISAAMRKDLAPSSFNRQRENVYWTRIPFFCLNSCKGRYINTEKLLVASFSPSDTQRFPPAKFYRKCVCVWLLCLREGRISPSSFLKNLFLFFHCR